MNIILKENNISVYNGNDTKYIINIYSEHNMKNLIKNPFCHCNNCKYINLVSKSLVSSLYEYEIIYYLFFINNI